jgi:hypothetical protein
MTSRQTNATNVDQLETSNGALPGVAFETNRTREQSVNECSKGIYVFDCEGNLSMKRIDAGRLGPSNRP